MPVIIYEKKTYSGQVTPPSLNTETTVIEIAGEDEEYMVEGYIDVSQLQSGDSITIREYIAVDGVNYNTYITLTLTGAQQDPVLRFHTKTLLRNMKYKITITQTSGTLRTFKYGFIEEVMMSV